MSKFQKEHIWFYISLGLISVLITFSSYTFFLISKNNEEPVRPQIERPTNPNARPNPNELAGENPDGNQEIPELEKTLFENLPESLRGGII